MTIQAYLTNAFKSYESIPPKGEYNRGYLDALVSVYQQSDFPVTPEFEKAVALSFKLSGSDRSTRDRSEPSPHLGASENK